MVAAFATTSLGLISVAAQTAATAPQPATGYWLLTTFFMTRQHILALLRKAPMFSAVEERTLGVLLDCCPLRPVKTDALIVLPTQKAEQFFVILSGRVKVFKLSQRGEEQTLHLYGPGETFGEAAMWAGIHYPAHAQAVVDSLLLVVSRSALRDAFSRSPDLAMGMLAGLSGKLREFNTLIEQLSLRDVPARLAHALLAMSRQKGAPTFHLGRSKRELASQLGTVPETLSRALAKLKRLHLIAVEASKITILDPVGLQEHARE